MRTRIGVSVVIEDKNDVITESSVLGRIFDTDGNILNSQIFDENKTTEQTITFNDLDEETKYRVEVKATIDGKSVTYYNQYITTTNVGASSDNPISIKTKDDFLNIQYDNNAYYVLENDIDFSEENGAKGSYTTLFNSTSSKFEGHIDGKGHSIKNLKINNSYTYVGLFGFIANGASISNLTIENVELVSSKGSELYLGALVGCNQGTLENVMAKNILIDHQGSGTSKQYIGGLVGVNTNVIKNSTVDTVTMNLRSRLQSTVGGFVGCNGGVIHTAIKGSIIEGCRVLNANITTKFETTRKVTLDDNVFYFQYTGGFVGESRIGIKDSYCEATITSTVSFTEGSVLELYEVSLGGFAGRTINGCKISGVASACNINLTTKDAFEMYVGALIGSAYDSILSNSVAYLTGENSVKNTADYSESENEDIKSMFAKSFDIIGTIKNELVNNPISSQTNIEWALASNASIKEDVEDDIGHMTITSPSNSFDTSVLTSTVKEFVNRYKA